MLSERILSTIKFFDLQDYPLTSFEVWRYLISDLNSLRKELDENYELPLELGEAKPARVHFDTVLTGLAQLSSDGQLQESNGFYFFPDRKSLVKLRLENYRFGLKREKLIRRYLHFTRNIPFVRGISLAGSQALGLQRATSDIDLLIITDPNFMWLARTFLTIYFQLLGVRRHHNKIANRFCLNHYIANTRQVDSERNLYKAMEYTKLRAVVYSDVTQDFQKANQNWIKHFFANVNFDYEQPIYGSVVQAFLEFLFNHKLGLWVEHQLGTIQLKRIKQDKYIFVKDDELSFHPESKHEVLLKGFFG